MFFLLFFSFDYHYICEENDELNSKLKNSLQDKRNNKIEYEIKNLTLNFEFFKSKLIIIDTELNNTSEGSEKLKL